MNKIGQRRGLWDKIKEKANPVGKLLEVKSKEFQELMENLRKIDDQVRLEASSLKDYIKAAKTNFNRREYMTAIFYLGNFHDRVEAIDVLFSQLEKNVDIKHHEFLFGDMDQEHLDYLTKHFSKKIENANKSVKKADDRAFIEKEAGITDWWHNITTDRGKTMGAWEKRFPKYSRELKKQTSNMIAKSESYLQTLLGALKRLASLRGSRKLEEYLKEAEKVKSKYRSYNAQFIEYYNSNVKRLIDLQNVLKGNDDKTKDAVNEEILSPMIEQIKKQEEGAIKLPSFVSPVPLENKREPITGLPGISPAAPAPVPSPVPSPENILSVKQDPFPAQPNILSVKQDPFPAQPNILSVKQDPFPAQPNILSVKQDPFPASHHELGKAPTIPSPVLNLRDPIIPKPPKVPSFVEEIPEAPLTGPPTPAPQIVNPLPTYREPPTRKSPMGGPITMKSRSSLKEFMTKLAQLENEHPLVVAKEIINYANQCSDLETKNKLLKIARNMI